MERTWGMLTCALAFLASIPEDALTQLRAPSLVGGAALLVLDLQVDFVDPAGRLPISHDQISPVLAAANRAIATENSEHLAVAYIGNEYGFWDIPGNWFRHGAAMKNSFGSALDPLVTRIAGAPTSPSIGVTLSRTTRSSAFSPATLEGCFLPASMPTLASIARRDPR